MPRAATRRGLRSGDRYPAVARSLWMIEYMVDGAVRVPMSDTPFVEEAVNPLRVTEVRTTVIT